MKYIQKKVYFSCIYVKKVVPLRSKNNKANIN